MKNEHISEYLKYYFELSDAPAYAVMISGEWGCGKTWFINKFMDDFSKSKKEPPKKEPGFINKFIDNFSKSKKEPPKKEPFMYISLYGMKDITEIDAAIFQNLHPILASKPATIAGNLLRGATKTGFHLDLNFNTLADMISSNTDKIMVFDDLERCYIPHQELFGYINRFVEHQKQKVVIVSYEEELFKKGEEGNTRKLKEKIIGATFNVEPDVNEAFNAFLGLVSDEHKKLLSKYQETIFMVYEKVGKNNLRILHQAIASFPYFLKQFPNKMIEFLESNNSLERYPTVNNSFKYVVRFFFYLFLEEKGGHINKANWEEAANIFISEEINYADFLNKPKEQQEDIRKHTTFPSIIHDGFQDGLLNSSWYDVVILNKNYSSELELVFKDMEEMERVNSKAVWVILNGLLDLEGPELKSKYFELLSDIEKNKVENIGELFHSFGILLHWAKHKIIKKTIRSIEELIKKKLNRNVANGAYELREGYLLQLNSWGGYSFIEHDSAEMKEMLSYYDQLQAKVKNNKLNNEFQELIKDLHKNIDVVCKEITFVEYYGKFSDKPFFSYIKSKERFFSKVLALSLRQMGRFMRALKERYMLRYSNGSIEERFLPEIELVDRFISFVELKKSKTSTSFNTVTKKCDYLYKDLIEIKNQFDKAKGVKQ